MPRKVWDEITYPFPNFDSAPTFWSGFCKFRQCYAIFQVKYCIHSLLGSPMEGAGRLIMLGLRVPHKGDISKILKLARQTGSSNQRSLSHLGHHQRISTPHEDRYLMRMMRFCQNPGKKTVNLSHCTLPGSAYHPASSCRGISFSQVAQCPELTLVHRQCRCQWARHLIFVFGTFATCDTVSHLTIKIQVVSHRWTSSCL